MENRSDKINIRRIGKDEHALFRQVRLAALRESTSAFGSTYEDTLKRSPDDWREQTATAAKGPNRALYVALREETPVGIGRIYRHEIRTDVGELMSVWVAPEHRGDGTATVLLDALFSWARKNGLQKILASVRNDNTRALTFYRNYGFVAAEDEVPDEPDESVLVMALAP